MGEPISTCCGSVSSWQPEHGLCGRTKVIDQDHFTIDRFEDNDLVVLETDNGTSMDVPRAHVPPEAREGDVLVELPENELDGDVKYAVDFELTKQRKAKVKKTPGFAPYP